ncbi:hypothetical protein CKM354_000060400 [Cercospora kikuchii]|uniref:Uncharacterized protein n=1 Tax=Cercospora kikuchii TaxID=84275 RepID=A0A9P3C990_9PEZI|nr:uncharacterized protein CKM354_000060400 [Cercospora kikuchii]GIZ37146.1 hypothetical protein CKM354_000060400 [Cercospora kikuchii]
MTKYRVPTRLRRTPKPNSRSTIVLNAPVDSTKRYISKIELINELFDLVLCEFNVQKLLRLRRVAQHWKSQIDSSSAVQRVLLLKSTIPRSIIELKFTHPQDLVERSASLSKVPRSRKNRVAVRLNALLCKKSDATDEPELFDRRIGKGDTVLLNPAIIIPHILSKGTRKEQFESAILSERVVTPQLKLEELFNDSQIDMLLTDPPVKAAWVSIFSNMAHARVVNPSGLRLRDISKGVDRSDVLEGILSCWHKMQPNNKRITLDIDGREGYVGQDKKEEVELRDSMADCKLSNGSKTA